MLKFVWPALSVLTLSACGGASTASAPNIVGGVKVGVNDIVAQSTASLSVQQPNGDWISCSGTLIDPTHVLTAAHCLDNNPTAVIVSIKNLDRRAVSSFKHFGYRREVLNQPFPSQPAHDIAVVKLSKAFTHVTPAQLSLASVKGGEQAIVAGFGESEDRDNSSLIKMSKQISFANGGLQEIGTSVSGGRTGWGDSGGPAYFVKGGKLEVAGVISRTLTIRGLDVYTDVGLHHAWITCLQQNEQREQTACTNVQFQAHRVHELKQR